MKRFSHPLKLAAIGLAVLAATAAARQMPDDGASDWSHGPGLRRLEKCLSGLDLSAEQQAAIESILSAARPTLQADAKALKADHQRLRTDISNGADKCVLGQDVLNQHASLTKLENDRQAVRDQILAKLTPEQQEKFNACSQGPRGRGMGRGRSGRR
jgi:Spy/CpxP family protein refolding chaperone